MGGGKFSLVQLRSVTNFQLVCSFRVAAFGYYFREQSEAVNCPLWRYGGVNFKLLIIKTYIIMFSRYWFIIITFRGVIFKCYVLGLVPLDGFKIKSLLLTLELEFKVIFKGRRACSLLLIIKMYKKQRLSNNKFIAKGNAILLRRFLPGNDGQTICVKK